jgi:ABC-2 type transport system ATP-binding protein
MEQTKITDMRNRRISALSKGYKQRVGIAQALLGNPKVIILDEPTVGLDPIQIIEIRDLIKQLGQEHTVILSSHILSEVQTICEKILIIAHGTLIAFDEAENLEKNLLTGNGIDLTAEATQEEVRSILSSVEEVVEIETSVSEAGLTRAHLKVSGDDIYGVSRQLFFAFADAGKALLELSLKKASLEDVFIELTETKPESEMVSEPVAKAEAESSESVAEPEPESNESEETVE